jgi:hypothetical protein
LVFVIGAVAERVSVEVLAGLGADVEQGLGGDEDVSRPGIDGGSELTRGWSHASAEEVSE